ncbi:MAG: ABC transporter substrate-binding protein [Eubacterium sp.]|nr:ABC transporter substrate-binding protein [Eubacterium sp.]
MKKTLSLLLILAMIAMSFAGCSSSGGSGGSSAAEESKPLVVGYSNFSSKFSPFFAETAYDQDVQGMTQVNLLGNDRLGQIVEKGKTGETRNYNGTDYEYKGAADLTVTENSDGTIDYDFDMRDDIKCSDGEPLTADDIIFSMYVLADPTYDGPSTFFSKKIKGMEDYRSGMSALLELLIAAGRDNKEFKDWDEATQTQFWADLDAGMTALAQDIVDYCVGNGYNADTDPVSACASNWGYDIPETATVEDFGKAIAEAYDGDYIKAISTEKATLGISELIPNYDNYNVGIKTGESADYIEGIQKTGDYSIKITMTEPDAAAVYDLAITIAPMHYYGDPEKYDYDAHKFGFDKGDLSTVRSKTTTPLGAGPYKFIKFENGVVSFEANENYYLGAPKTKNMQFLESQDTDKLNGIVTGTIDITDPSYSTKTYDAICEANGNGDVNGDKIITMAVDNNGYGYLGMCAKVMKVGDDPSSDQSKALRKAFATVLCNYRDVTVDSYYGNTASVVNYPISNTSWAAPQKTDADYAVAFSKDVDGNDIYTSDMDPAAKEEAALNAALGFFEKAGYTVENGKVTKAPEGASLEYEVWIPADGTGDHPSFMMLNLASDAFKKIGITLTVKDLANSADLWTALSAQSLAMWCAAWGASLDPSAGFQQVYYADVKNGGAHPGGNNYMYAIADAELDDLIQQGATNTDQAYRKSVYKACFDIIIDWAVEVPVYQRQNVYIFSPERVNMDTVAKDMTSYYDWRNEVQTIEMK